MKRSKAVKVEREGDVSGTISTSSELRSSGKKLRTLRTQMNHGSILDTPCSKSRKKMHLNPEVKFAVRILCRFKVANRTWAAFCMGTWRKWKRICAEREIYVSLQKATLLTPTVKWMAIVVKTVLLRNFSLTSRVNQLPCWTLQFTEVDGRICCLQNYEKENTRDVLQYIMLPSKKRLWPNRLF